VKDFAPSVTHGADFQRSCAGLRFEFLAVYDVSDSVAAAVEADAATTWDALIEVDLIEVGRRRHSQASLAHYVPYPKPRATCCKSNSPYSS
jgi:hypothetical protein